MKLKLLSKFVIGSLLAVTMLFPVAVNANVNANKQIDDDYYYNFVIRNVNQGYNWGVPQTREAHAVYAYISITNNPSNLMTNFIVINSNGVQLTPAVNFSQNEKYQAYYSRGYLEGVILRANSGSTTVNYSVSGRWSPNAYDIWPR